MVARQIEELGGTELWRHARGAGVKVAVLDSGVGISRGLPASRVRTLHASGKDQGPLVAPHGTYCASLIGSQKLDAEGVAPEAEILGIQVTQGSGEPSVSLVKQALKRALEEDCQVISCSFTLSRINPELRELVREAHLAGVPVVAAAGNDPDQPARFAEDVAHAIVVGALTGGGAPMRGRHTLWTDIYCLGEGLDVVAPGGVTQSWRGRSSGATALVSGIIALGLSAIEPAQRARAGLAIDNLLKETSVSRPFRGANGPPRLLRIDPLAFIEKLRFAR